MPTPAAPGTPDSHLAAARAGLFFIVGCGRSGTTLLQSALSAHASVTVPPETKFYPAYASWRWRRHDLSREPVYRRVAEEIWADQKKRGFDFNHDTFLEHAAAAPRSWDGLFLAILATTMVDHEATRVGEKSPSHTPYVAQLAQTFPEAQFIHVIRDPRAVVHSRVRAGFGTRLLGPNIERWREAVAMHQRHGVELGGTRYHLVRYEQLVTDLDRTLRGVCAFLDLELTDEMLNPHRRATRGFAERSSEWMENTLKPVFTTSIERWRSEMPQRQIALVEAATREEMSLMGYEPIGAKTIAPHAQLAGSRCARLCERTWRRSRRKVQRLTTTEEEAETPDA